MSKKQVGGAISRCEYCTKAETSSCKRATDSLFYSILPISNSRLKSVSIGRAVYLLIVDCLTKWSFVKCFQSDRTSGAVIEYMKEVFAGFAQPG